jgi:hypothetical protein
MAGKEESEAEMRKIARFLASALAIIVLAEIADLAWLSYSRATINSQINKVVLGGNGAQTVFGFSFIGVAASDISVTFTDASGNQTLLTQGSGPTQYQLSLNAPVSGAIWGVGGTITYNPSGTPIASGTTLTILRTVPLTQTVSLTNQGAFFPTAVETGLDLLAMQIQQLSELYGRAIVAPPSDPPTVNLTLPPAAQRANTGLAFDGSGNVIAGVTPASGTISSAMQPVVNAASLAAGRTAFGLGTMAQENINGGTCGGSTLQDDGAGNARVVFATVPDAANQSVTCAFHGQVHTATGSLIYTLPRANTLFNGFGFWVYALNGVITFATNAADGFSGLASGASMIVPAGTAVFVSTNAGASGTWFADVSAVQSVPLSGTWYSNSLSAPPLCGAVGLKITNGGTPNSMIALTADQVVLQDSAGRTVNRNSVSLTGISLLTGTSTPTANGMDGEAPGTSSWQYIWAIDNGSAPAGLVSKASGNGLNPTLPTGYTYKCRLGAMINDGSGNLFRTLQLGSEAQWQVTAATNTTALPVITISLGTFWTAQAAGGFVPPTATEIFVAAQFVLNINSTSNSVLIAGVAPNANYGLPNASTGAPPCGGGVSNNGGTYNIINVITMNCRMLLESTNIYTGSAATFGAGIFTNSIIAAFGWKDKVNAQ